MIFNFHSKKQVQYDHLVGVFATSDAGAVLRSKKTNKQFKFTSFHSMHYVTLALKKYLCLILANTVKLSKYDYQIKHKDGYTDLHRHGNIKVRINIKHLHLNSSFNRQM